MLPNGQYVVMASVANGNLLNHIQHHYMHDALIVHVSNSTIRWGLVGISFGNVSLEINHD
jgi:lipopolysaccharide transport system ATP-binding protein